jgi:hypothetical protein
MAFVCRVVKGGKTEHQATYRFPSAEERDAQDRREERELNPYAWSPRRAHGPSLDDINRARGIRAKQAF